jgi:hypothetical protein
MPSASDGRSRGGGGVSALTYAGAMDAWTAVGAFGSIAAAVVAAWAAYQSRSSAQEANRAANTLAHIERDRRHSELCPSFRLSSGPLGEADYHGVFRLRVLLAGPPALGQLDRLTVMIRDDVHTGGEGTLTAGGPTRDQIKRQIWGSYRFTPGTGPDDARADATGRETAYEGVLPVGEALVYQLEPNPPPPWSKWTPEEWKRQQGTVLRLALIAERAGLGSWRLAGEVDVGDGQTQVEAHIP